MPKLDNIKIIIVDNISNFFKHISTTVKMTTKFSFKFSSHRESVNSCSKRLRDATFMIRPTNRWYHATQHYLSYTAPREDERRQLTTFA